LVTFYTRPGAKEKCHEQRPQLPRGTENEQVSLALQASFLLSHTNETFQKKIVCAIQKTTIYTRVFYGYR